MMTKNQQKIPQKQRKPPTQNKGRYNRNANDRNAPQQNQLSLRDRTMCLHTQAHPVRVNAPPRTPTTAWLTHGPNDKGLKRLRPSQRNLHIRRSYSEQNRVQNVKLCCEVYSTSW